MRPILLVIVALGVVSLFVFGPAALARNKTTPQTKAKIEQNTTDIVTLQEQLQQVLANQEQLLTTMQAAVKNGTAQRAEIIEHIQEVDEEIEGLQQ